MSKKQPAGIRNRNPLNVKGKVWRGATGVDGRGHAIFDSPALGTRAAIRLLRTYWTKHRLRTVPEILSRWAPSSDTVGSLPGAPPNSPREYAVFVLKRLPGQAANEDLRTFNESGTRVRDKVQLRALLAAMARYELGQEAPVAWLQTGIEEFEKNG